VHSTHLAVSFTLKMSLCVLGDRVQQKVLPHPLNASLRSFWWETPVLVKPHCCDASVMDSFIQPPQPLWVSCTLPPCAIYNFGQVSSSGFNRWLPFYWSLLYLIRRMNYSNLFCYDLNGLCIISITP